jgi:hypothetical protein
MDHQCKLANPIRTNDYLITTDQDQTKYDKENEISELLFSGNHVLIEETTEDL